MVEDKTMARTKMEKRLRRLIKLRALVRKESWPVMSDERNEREIDNLLNEVCVRVREATTEEKAEQLTDEAVKHCTAKLKRGGGAAPSNAELEEQDEERPWQKSVGTCAYRVRPRPDFLKERLPVRRLVNRSASSGKTYLGGL